MRQGLPWKRHKLQENVSSQYNCERPHKFSSNFFTWPLCSHPSPPPPPPRPSPWLRHCKRGLLPLQNCALKSNHAHVYVQRWLFLVVVARWRCAIVCRCGRQVAACRTLRRRCSCRKCRTRSASDSGRRGWVGGSAPDTTWSIWASVRYVARLLRTLRVEGSQNTDISARGLN